MLPTDWLATLKAATSRQRSAARLSVDDGTRSRLLDLHLELGVPGATLLLMRTADRQRFRQTVFNTARKDANDIVGRIKPRG